jgi:hypothetical protein
VRFRRDTFIIIAYSPDPVEIQAGLLEPGKDSLGIPYIRHFVIVLAANLKALFYITPDFCSMVARR